MSHWYLDKLNLYSWILFPKIKFKYLRLTFSPVNNDDRKLQNNTIVIIMIIITCIYCTQFPLSCLDTLEWMWSMRQLYVNNLPIVITW